MPIPASPAHRRVLYAPVAALLALALAWPWRFFSSDIEHNRGIWHAKAKRWDQALASFERVSKWHDAGVTAAYFTGNVRLDQDGRFNLQAALRAYAQVEAMWPGFYRVDFQKAQARYRLADFQGAAEAFEVAVRREPDSKAAWEKLAEVSTIVGRKERALEAAVQLARLEPANAHWWGVVSKKYRELGNKQAARRALDKAHRVHELAGNGKQPPL